MGIAEGKSRDSGYKIQNRFYKMGYPYLYSQLLLYIGHNHLPPTNAPHAHLKRTGELQAEQAEDMDNIS